MSSLPITTFFALPKIFNSAFSKVTPYSSSITYPPTNTPMSDIWLFLLSPNAGALTQHTLIEPFSLFKINVVIGSFSTSSAIIKIGLPSLIAYSKNFNTFYTLETF